MTPATATRLPKPLRGVRVLSLALNLPGPAALMRCGQMGARCTKLDPPAGDPMAHYDAAAHAQLHHGVRVQQADLKTPAGQRTLHRLLAHTDVLLTSFRPSALRKLGLGWRDLHRQHPLVSCVAIVGARGEQAEEPGHDLTYLAEAGLLSGTQLPSTLYADMAGSLMASEAVLQAVLLQRQRGRGSRFEVALADAARYLALPHQWGLTQPTGAVGGAHAGYRVYPCQDGRVALAALEPHFARSLLKLVSPKADAASAPFNTLFDPATHAAVARWCKRYTRAELDALAQQHDLPLHTLA